MANEFYDHTTYPSTGAAGSSSAMRAELELIEAGFAKLPVPSTNPGELVVVNAGGTALESVAAGLTTEVLTGGGAATPPTWTAIAGNFATPGANTIYVPASAMVARTTNGAASGTAETTTNKVMLKTLDFDAATIEYAQFSVRMPKGWNESTVTAYFLWSNAAGTGNVVWALQGLARSDDDALDTAFGTAVTVTDGVTAAGDLMQSAATSAITIGGTPAEADWVVFQVYRNASDGADTFATDARLHGVVVIYTTNASNDA